MLNTLYHSGSKNIQGDTNHMNNYHQTSKIQTEKPVIATTGNPQGFSGVLRDAKPTDAVALIEGKGVCIGDRPVSGPQAAVVQGLLAHGEQLTAADLRIMVLSGLFRSITVHGHNAERIVVRGVDGKPEIAKDLKATAQARMKARYEAAPEKGVALIVRTEAGRVKGIMNGQHVAVEALCLGMAQVGGYYPAYVVEKQVQARDPKTGVVGPKVMQFLVPLHFEEETRDVAQARFAFGQPLPWAYVEQAIVRAEANQPVIEAAVEDAKIAALASGGKLTLGAFANVGA